MDLMDGLDDTLAFRSGTSIFSRALNAPCKLVNLKQNPPKRTDRSAGIKWNFVCDLVKQHRENLELRASVGFQMRRLLNDAVK